MNTLNTPVPYPVIDHGLRLISAEADRAILDDPYDENYVDWVPTARLEFGLLSGLAAWVQRYSEDVKVFIVLGDHVHSFDFHDKTYEKYLEEYSDRLSELEQLAIEDGTSSVNEESKRDFFNFLCGIGFRVRRADLLVLLDNGFLRATWIDDDWRMGLKFLGRGNVSFVLIDLNNIPEGKTGKTRVNELDIDYQRFKIKNLLSE